MDFGSTAYLDKNALRLPLPLLRPLFVQAGTPIFGMYYPPRKTECAPPKRNRKEDDSSNAHIRHDLVLTSLPFELWPFCAQGRIDIRHEPKSLRRVLEIFKALGLNVIFARCHRTTHHWATFSFVLELSRLRIEAHEKNWLPAADSTEKDASEYAKRLVDRCSQIRRFLPIALTDKKHAEKLFKREFLAAGMEEQEDAADLAKKVYIECHKDLERELKENAAGSLFEEIEENRQAPEFSILSWRTGQEYPFKRRPIELWALKSLAYYHAMATSKEMQESLVCPAERFEGTARDARTIDINNRRYFFRKTQIELPSVGVANFNSDEMVIRIAIPTADHLSRFRALEFNYLLDRDNSHTTTEGLMERMLAQLGDEWNLWAIANSTSAWRENHEAGTIRLVMERQIDRHLPMRSDKEKILSKLRNIQSFRGCDQPANDQPAIEDVRLMPYSSRKVFISIKSEGELERHNEILKRCKAIGEEFGFLAENVRTVKTIIGDSVSEEVVRQIEESSGLIQFIMSDKENSSFTWLEAEFFLATHLGIPRVRIVDQRLESSIKFMKDKFAIKISNYISADSLSARIREAFEELDKSFWQQCP